MRWALVRLADTLTRVWVVFVWMVASWWILTFAATCAVIVILIWPAFGDHFTFTFARCFIEVLIVWAGLVLGALAATGLGVKVLTSVAIIWSTDTLAGI